MNSLLKNDKIKSQLLSESKLGLETKVTKKKVKFEPKSSRQKKVVAENREAAKERREKHEESRKINRYEPKIAIKGKLKEEFALKLNLPRNDSLEGAEDILEMINLGKIEDQSDPGKKIQLISSYQGSDATSFSVADYVRMVKAVNLKKLSQDKLDAFKALNQSLAKTGDVLRLINGNRRLTTKIYETIVWTRSKMKDKVEAMETTETPTNSAKTLAVNNTYKAMKVRLQMDHIDAEGTKNYMKQFVDNKPVIANQAATMEGGHVEVQQKMTVVKAYYNIAMEGPSEGPTDYISRFSDLTLGNNRDHILKFAQEVLATSSGYYYGRGDIWGQLVRTNTVFQHHLMSVEMRKKTEKEEGKIFDNLYVTAADSYFSSYCGMHMPDDTAAFLKDILLPDGKLAPISEWEVRLTDREEVEDTGDIELSNLYREDGKYYKMTKRYQCPNLNLKGQAGPGYNALLKQEVLDIVKAQHDDINDKLFEQFDASLGRSSYDPLSDYPFLNCSYFKPKAEPNKFKFGLQEDFATPSEQAEMVEGNLKQAKVRNINVCNFLAVIGAQKLIGIFSKLKETCFDEHNRLKEEGHPNKSKMSGQLFPLYGFAPNNGGVDLLMRRITCMGEFKYSSKAYGFTYSDNFYLSGRWVADIPSEFFKIPKDLIGLTYAAPSCSDEVKSLLAEGKVKQGTRALFSFDGVKAESATDVTQAAIMLETLGRYAGFTPYVREFLEKVLRPVCCGGYGIFGESKVKMNFNVSGSPMTFYLNDLNMYMILARIFKIGEIKERREAQGEFEDFDESNLDIEIEPEEVIAMAAEFGVNISVERVTLYTPGIPMADLNDESSEIKIDLLGNSVFPMEVITEKGRECRMGFALEKQRVIRSLAFQKPENPLQGSLTAAELSAAKSLSLIYSGAFLYPEVFHYLVSRMIGGYEVFGNERINELEEQMDLPSNTRKSYYDALKYLNDQAHTVIRGEKGLLAEGEAKISKSVHHKNVEDFMKNLVLRVVSLMTEPDTKVVPQTLLNADHGMLWTTPKTKEGINDARKALMVSGEYDKHHSVSYAISVNALYWLHTLLKGEKLIVKPQWIGETVLDPRNMQFSKNQADTLAQIVAKVVKDAEDFTDSSHIDKSAVVRRIKSLVAADPDVFIKDYPQLLSKRMEELESNKAANSLARSEKSQRKKEQKQLLIERASVKDHPITEDMYGKGDKLKPPSDKLTRIRIEGTTTKVIDLVKVELQEGQDPVIGLKKIESLHMKAFKAYGKAIKELGIRLVHLPQDTLEYLHTAIIQQSNYVNSLDVTPYGSDKSEEALLTSLVSSLKDNPIKKLNKKAREILSAMVTLTPSLPKEIKDLLLDREETRVIRVTDMESLRMSNAEINADPASFVETWRIDLYYTILHSLSVNRVLRLLFERNYLMDLQNWAMSGKFNDKDRLLVDPLEWWVMMNDRKQQLPTMIPKSIDTRAGTGKREKQTFVSKEKK